MKHHRVQNVDFDADTLVLTVDDRTLRLPLSAVSERLSRANEAARRFYRISPSGYGIHWPEVDEDLSIDGLIRTAEEYSAQSAGAAVLRETHE